MITDVYCSKATGPKKDIVYYELGEENGIYTFSCEIESALDEAKEELVSLQETIDVVRALKPECDRTDYALAACCGILCGILDVVFIGKPGSSVLGNLADDWFMGRTKDFAKIFGWDGTEGKSAISFLENKFEVPYDQRGAGDAGQIVFGLTPSNHHFKSLAHNPSILGLFFSILDQFSNTSHFVSDGKLIALQKADDSFELRGKNIPAKLFCALCNWIGHIFSDISGASGSKGRGTGIPSPLWTWMNDVIAIKEKLGIDSSGWDQTFNDLALEIFKNGYDTRFQSIQAIPVFINEIVVRLVYSIRRMLAYYSKADKAKHSWSEMWRECKPFSNTSVMRMLTVAHGTFCLIDAGDAAIRAMISGGGNFNPVEFFLRLNIIGIGRFSICLYKEATVGIRYFMARDNADIADRKKAILSDYINALNGLARKNAENNQLMVFVENLRNSEMVKNLFERSTELVESRGGVPLRTKSDIDNYFNHGKE